MSKLHNMDLNGFLDCAASGLRPEDCGRLGGFSEACYNDNSVDELLEALRSRSADKTDCHEWKITPSQWRGAINEAIEHAMYLYVVDNDLK